MIRRMTLVACLMVSVAAWGATPRSAFAEECQPVMPYSPDEASGYTFEARVSGIRTEGTGAVHTYIAMDVSTVYANGGSDRLAKGKTIELYSNPCDGFGLLGLHVGDEILMSTAGLESKRGVVTRNTAVWIREAGALRLLVLHLEGFGTHWLTSDRRIEGAHTTRQALALVGPSSGAPDTSTVPRSIPPANANAAVLVLAALVGSLLAIARFRPRQSRRPTVVERRPG